MAKFRVTAPRYTPAMSRAMRLGQYMPNLPTPEGLGPEWEVGLELGKIKATHPGVRFASISSPDLPPGAAIRGSANPTTGRITLNPETLLTTAVGEFHTPVSAGYIPAPPMTPGQATRKVYYHELGHTLGLSAVGGPLTPEMAETAADVFAYRKLGIPIPESVPLQARLRADLAYLQHRRVGEGVGGMAGYEAAEYAIPGKPRRSPVPGGGYGFTEHGFVQSGTYAQGSVPGKPTTRPERIFEGPTLPIGMNPALALPPPGPEWGTVSQLASMAPMGGQLQAVHTPTGLTPAYQFPQSRTSWVGGVPKAQEDILSLQAGPMDTPMLGYAGGAGWLVAPIFGQMSDVSHLGAVLSGGQHPLTSLGIAGQLREHTRTESGPRWLPADWRDRYTKAMQYRIGMEQITAPGSLPIGEVREKLGGEWYAREGSKSRLAQGYGNEPGRVSPVSYLTEHIPGWFTTGGKLSSPWGEGELPKILKRGQLMAQEYAHFGYVGEKSTVEMPRTTSMITAPSGAQEWGYKRRVAFALDAYAPEGTAYARQSMGSIYDTVQKTVELPEGTDLSSLVGLSGGYGQKIGLPGGTSYDVGAWSNAQIVGAQWTGEGRAILDVQRSMPSTQYLNKFMGLKAQVTAADLSAMGITDPTVAMLANAPSDWRMMAANIMGAWDVETAAQYGLDYSQGPIAWTEETHDRLSRAFQQYLQENITTQTLKGRFTSEELKMYGDRASNVKQVGENLYSADIQTRMLVANALIRPTAAEYSPRTMGRVNLDFLAHMQMTNPRGYEFIKELTQPYRDPYEQFKVATLANQPNMPFSMRPEAVGVAGRGAEFQQLVGDTSELTEFERQKREFAALKQMFGASTALQVGGKTLAPVGSVERMLTLGFEGAQKSGFARQYLEAIVKGMDPSSYGDEIPGLAERVLKQSEQMILTKEFNKAVTQAEHPGFVKGGITGWQGLGENIVMSPRQLYRMFGADTPEKREFIRQISEQGDLPVQFLRWPESQSEAQAQTVLRGRTTEWAAERDPSFRLGRNAFAVGTEAIMAHGGDYDWDVGVGMPMGRIVEMEGGRLKLERFADITSYDKLVKWARENPAGEYGSRLRKAYGLDDRDPLKVAMEAIQGNLVPEYLLGGEATYRAMAAKATMGGTYNVGIRMGMDFLAPRSFPATSEFAARLYQKPLDTQELSQGAQDFMNIMQRTALYSGSGKFGLYSKNPETGELDRYTYGTDSWAGASRRFVGALADMEEFRDPRGQAALATLMAPEGGSVLSLARVMRHNDMSTIEGQQALYAEMVRQAGGETNLLFANSPILNAMFGITGARAQRKGQLPADYGSKEIEAILGPLIERSVPILEMIEQYGGKAEGAAAIAALMEKTVEGTSHHPMAAIQAAALRAQAERMNPGLKAKRELMDEEMKDIDKLDLSDVEEIPLSSGNVAAKRRKPVSLDWDTLKKQKISGFTKSRVEKLEAAGYSTLDEIVQETPKTLSKKVKGIGKVSAEAVIEGAQSAIDMEEVRVSEVSDIDSASAAQPPGKPKASPAPANVSLTDPGVVGGSKDRRLRPSGKRPGGIGGPPGGGDGGKGPPGGGDSPDGPPRDPPEPPGGGGDDGWSDADWTKYVTGKTIHSRSEQFEWNAALRHLKEFAGATKNAAEGLLNLDKEQRAQAKRMVKVFDEIEKAGIRWKEMLSPQEQKEDWRGSWAQSIRAGMTSEQKTYLDTLRGMLAEYGDIPEVPEKPGGIRGFQQRMQARAEGAETGAGALGWGLLAQGAGAAERLAKFPEWAMSGWGLFAINRAWNMMGAPAFRDADAYRSYVASMQAGMMQYGLVDREQLTGDTELGRVLRMARASERSLLARGRVAEQTWGGVQEWLAGAFGESMSGYAEAVLGPAAAIGTVAALSPLGLGAGLVAGLGVATIGTANYFGQTAMPGTEPEWARWAGAWQRGEGYNVDFARSVQYDAQRFLLGALAPARATSFPGTAEAIGAVGDQWNTWMSRNLGTFTEIPMEYRQTALQDWASQKWLDEVMPLTPIEERGGVMQWYQGRFTAEQKAALARPGAGMTDQEVIRQSFQRAWPNAAAEDIDFLMQNYGMDNAVLNAAYNAGQIGGGWVSNTMLQGEEILRMAGLDREQLLARGGGARGFRRGSVEEIQYWEELTARATQAQESGEGMQQFYWELGGEGMREQLAQRTRRAGIEKHLTISDLELGQMDEVSQPILAGIIDSLSGVIESGGVDGPIRDLAKAWTNEISDLVVRDQWGVALQSVGRMGEISGAYRQAAMFGGDISDQFERFRITASGAEWGRQMSLLQGNQLAWSMFGEENLLGIDPTRFRFQQTTGPFQGMQRWYSQAPTGAEWERLLNAPESQFTSQYFQLAQQYGVNPVEALQGGTAQVGIDIATTQREMQLAQRQYRDWQFQLQGAVTTGQGLGAFVSGYEGMGDWYFQDQQRRISREQQDYNIAQQQQRLEVGNQDWAMQYRQFMERWQFGWGRMQTQFGWQEQDMTEQRRQQLRGRTWEQEDWSFQDSMRDLGFGWQMEDYDEAIRFSRGRERRRLMRRRDREVIQYSMGVSQTETERERQQEVWEDQDKRFEIEKERVEQQKQWAEEEMEMSKRHFEERRRLGEETRRLEREGFEQQKRWIMEERQLEDQKLARDRQIWEIQRVKEEEHVKRIDEWSDRITGLNTTLQMLNTATAEDAAQFQFLIQTLNQVTAGVGVLNSALAGGVWNMGAGFGTGNTGFSYGGQTTTTGGGGGTSGGGNTSGFFDTMSSGAVNVLRDILGVLNNIDQHGLTGAISIMLGGVQSSAGGEARGGLYDQYLRN